MDIPDGDPSAHAETYDWSVTDPSAGVVEVVSCSVGCREGDLTCLYDAVDPDALDALVSEVDGVGVSFRYAAHDVIVESDGTVSARPLV